MSRIDDSDNQRIKEMQEQELRTRMDRDKKTQEAKVAKSFNQVMAERGTKQSAQAKSQTRAGNQAAETKEKEKNALQSLLNKAPKSGAELNKRAALSNALAQGMAKKRADDGQNVRRAEADRTEELTMKTDEERERIDRDVRDEVDADIQRAEEREAEFKRINADRDGGAGEDQRTDKDGRRSRDGQSDEEQPKAQGVQAAEAKGASAPHEPRIPPEVIDKMVNAIYSAHTADGRTELHIDLKGTMLEGVRLEVRAKDGKVSCTFKNCSKEMKALLESSKGALMRGLGRKGMNLVSMKIEGR